MNQHLCGNCGHVLSVRFNRSGKRVWECAVCGYDHTAQTPTGDVRRAVENTVSPEAIIGGTGPTWAVTAWMDKGVTDDFHVRAETSEGAIALGQEVRPDSERIDVYQIDEGEYA